MTSTQKVDRSRYSVGDCAIAAFAGALANSSALSMLPKVSWAASISLVPILFIVGYAVLTFAGRPMARKLAAEGRDTLANGFLLGAATGSLVGTLLAGILIASLFRSPTAAFSIVTPLFGLISGIVDGAVSGITFVWLGRRKGGFTDYDQPEDARVTKRFRYTWLLVALGLGLPAAAILSITFTARKKPPPQPFPIAGTTYRWPADTRISPPQPPGYYGKGYVSYRSSERYPDPDAFFITYDGNAQEALNEAGLPHLQFITSRFDKPEEFSFRTTSAGQVVCRRRSVEVGIAYPCGLSFVHRGARWQLKFGAHRAADAERIYKEAISRLESFRRQSGKMS